MLQKQKTDPKPECVKQESTPPAHPSPVNSNTVISCDQHVPIATPPNPIQPDPLQESVEQKGLDELLSFINGTQGDKDSLDKATSAKAAKRARQKQRKVNDIEATGVKVFICLFFGPNCCRYLIGYGVHEDQTIILCVS